MSEQERVFRKAGPGPADVEAGKRQIRRSQKPQLALWCVCPPLSSEDRAVLGASRSRQVAELRVGAGSN